MGIFGWLRKLGKTDSVGQADVRDLSAQVGFDEDVVRLVAKEAGGSLSQLTGFANRGDEVLVTGIAAVIQGQVDYGKIMNLQKTLFASGYFAFSSSQPHSGPDAIALIHTSDPYDALRIKATNGINYGVETDDIIDKLTKWQQEFSFTIVAVDYDRVELILDSLPSDMDAFAQELYGFCPDIVEQGTESVEALVEEIRENKFIFLWWD